MKNVGIVGFSQQDFDKEKARRIIIKTFDRLEDELGSELSIVSGLTNLGIPAIAYKEAARRGYKTVGIACKQAKEYECFDCDEKIIVGEEWGDESEKFLSSIDYLVRIGGGKQSKEETQQAKKLKIPVLEFDV